MIKEQSLILIKPDGVCRGLIGKIITRFEEAGLKIIAMKMLLTDEELAKNHYFLDEEWAKNIFAKTKAAYEKENKEFPFKNYIDIGKTIQSWNMRFLREGPVIAFVLEGNHAIELVRKMVGSTEPRQAAPGTIRGDFAAIESYVAASLKKCVLRNLIHASDSLESAKREITLWFKPEELHDYKTLHDLYLEQAE